MADQVVTAGRAAVAAREAAKGPGREDLARRLADQEVRRAIPRGGLTLGSRLRELAREAEGWGPGA
jgi:hypothetical protein